ncbi:uncharacterized protein LTR77_002340 [Saxophila tyrrhenica]|uniref:Uncharacterized protein n=1 Tax=Saxophila tyrrhenica TaxID=1690608 RepID=A0AAV9PIW7_9PEZI|nr:hypothetical protein LTR77_002340 [Saxophila tyrrhenica]
MQFTTLALVAALAGSITASPGSAEVRNDMAARAAYENMGRMLYEPDRPNASYSPRPPQHQAGLQLRSQSHLQ